MYLLDQIWQIAHWNLYKDHIPIEAVQETFDAIVRSDEMTIFSTTTAL